MNFRPMVANIGFQGMTIRTPEKLVAPALQVLLGGGNKGNSEVQCQPFHREVEASRDD